MSGLCQCHIYWIPVVPTLLFFLSLSPSHQHPAAAPLLPFLTLSTASHTDERWKPRTSWRSHRPFAVPLGLRSTYCATWLMPYWLHGGHIRLTLSLGCNRKVSKRRRRSRRSGGTIHRTDRLTWTLPLSLPTGEMSRAHGVGLQSWCDCDSAHRSIATSGLSRKRDRIGEDLTGFPIFGTAEAPFDSMQSVQ